MGLKNGRNRLPLCAAVFNFHKLHVAIDMINSQSTNASFGASNALRHATRLALRPTQKIATVSENRALDQTNAPIHSPLLFDTQALSCAGGAAAAFIQ
ncbi:hypothetical protein ABIC09_003642 [Bradyrhizobium sp. S3.12.5]